MLEAEGVSIAYARDGAAVPALRGVSLRVQPGQIVAVAGANGSGKSTLARALCGAELAAGGRVVADGHDPAAGEEERRTLRRLVGIVRQNPQDQIVAARVGDEVAFGPRNLGLPEPEVAARVRAALEAVGLAGFEERETRALSGGEEQRLAIAGVLAMEPRYLVFDEPSAHLDAELRPRLLELLRALAAEQGAGVVLVTHEAREALAADELLVLEAGAVAWRGAPRDLLLGHPELWDAVFMPCPEAAALRGGATAAAGAADGGVAAADAAAAADLVAGGGTAGAAAPQAAPTATRGPELVFDSVSFGYGGRRVLDGLSFRARPGRVLLVAGPSGSGKSTLAALAAGLLAPERGSIALGATAPEPGAVGLALQHPEQQFFLDTVHDELAFGPRNAGLAEEEVAARVARALAVVGLEEELAGRDPFSLSGGQARRVGLAAVLSLDAAAYVFDEPTAGLDVAGRRAVHRMARSLAEDGCAVLVISHDLEEWLPVADDVLRLGPAPAGPIDPAAGEVPAPASGSASTPDSAVGEEPAPAPAPAAPAPVPAPAPRLDARVKIALLLELTAALFLAPGPAALACCAVALLVALWRAGVRPGSVARALKPAAFALALVLCANAVRCDGSGELALAGPLGLSAAGALAGAAAVARILVLVGFVVAAAATTTAAELAEACLRLLRPLGRAGLPVEELGSALSLAIRFVPIVGDEFQRIQLAQRARGVRLDAGPVLERIGRWLAVFAPFLIGLFRRADRLAESMAARCYAGAAAVAPRRLAARDWLALAAGTLAMAAMVLVAG